MENLTVNPNHVYKARVKAIKRDLPKGFRKIIFDSFPKYNTANGSTLINNVVAGRTADLKLTEILEQIAKNNTANIQLELK